VAGSDLTVMCVSDQVAARGLLDGSGVAEAARGRTIVQLTSGTPADARAGAAWAAGHGVGYLDGAIMAYPSGIGQPETVLVYSGSKDIYDRHTATLAALGGLTSHVGDSIGAASALDCALLASYYAASVGYLYGAALCASERFPIPDYTAAYKDVLPVFGASADMCEAMLDSGEYKGTDCTLDVHTAGVRNIARMSHENAVDPKLVETILSYFELATEVGHGPDEIAAVFNVLRRN
jgi:3-hydroxyisobutyrate dehydrogenase-like beta-hydroxyacid dehydrogenase